MTKLCERSRRNFLAQGLAGAAALGVTALCATGEPQTRAERSRVVVARDPHLRGPDAKADSPASSGIDTRRLQALLDQAVAPLFGFPATEKGAVAAWRRVVGAGRTVSLKVNTLGGRGMATNVELVEAACERLQQAGVAAPNITVWDRDSEEMERAGFRIATGGGRVQCYGTDHVGYEEDLAAWGSVGSRLSRILTRSSDVLINLPVLKDHDGAGVTIALKNMYGVIHNPNKYHPNGCNPYVADLNMLTEIRARMRLAVCDATAAMYEGGPGFKPQFSWPCNALLAAEDPVALDFVGWQMIERKRAEMGLQSLEAEKRAPRYIATAADREHHLGHADPAQIQLVEV